jgi:hypothetical protein
MGWLARLSVATGPNANAQTNPSRRPGFHIAHFVPHNRAASEIETEVQFGLQEHSRIGFAPRMLATVLANAVQGVIRAVIDSGNCRAFRFKAIAHPSRQVRIGVFVEIAAADPGLVRHDNDWPPQLVAS